MVVEKLKEREDKRDEERDKVHNPDLEQRVAELERVVKELIKYKKDNTVQRAELDENWHMKITWIGFHEYRFNP